MSPPPTFLVPDGHKGPIPILKKLLALATGGTACEQSCRPPLQQILVPKKAPSNTLCRHTPTSAWVWGAEGSGSTGLRGRLCGAGP